MSCEAIHFQPERLPVNEAYRSTDELEEEFSAAYEQLHGLIGMLRSKDAVFLAHGDVESLVYGRGMEVLRLVLQGYLDCRAREEARQPDGIVGSDEVRRGQVRTGCERSLMTVVGEVQVRRLGYQSRGETSIFPLDGELNLPTAKYSHGLMRRVAQEASRTSFDEVVSSVPMTTGGKVPKRQAEEIVVEVSQDFEDFYASRRATSPEATRDLLCLSVDGKGIVMREEALRQVTREAARRDRHKLKTRLCRGEKSHRKRMATVATVYTMPQHVRTAETIMSHHDDKVVPLRPRAQNKRVWASVEREPAVVIGEMLQEALRRDPAQRRCWVMLVDGQPQQIQQIHAAMAEHQVKATLVLDFIHVLEYLWKAAYCFHEEGTAQVEQWVSERALSILKGNSSIVAAGMRRSATRRGLTTEARKAVDKCAGYLLKYRDLLRYDQFLTQGFPIATGVIEGACRHLVKDRMDITGARWSLKGAEAILKLRSLRSSKDFDDYWAFYMAKSFTRNHASRYHARNKAA